MRKVILFFLIIYPTLIFTQNKNYRKLTNLSFRRGEKLAFQVYYHSMLTGNVSAGKVELEIKDENMKISGRNTMHIVGTGWSVGAFNWFFKVNDRYDTYIDEDAIAPWLFFRRVDEGGYKINQDVYFDQNRNYALSKEKGQQRMIKVPEYTQDIISFFYCSRLMDASKLKVNDSLPFKFFLDDSVYTIKIIFQGRETIKTKAGKFKCLRLKPMVLTGNVFKDPYPMTIWISDDDNHIPILASSALIVGAVRLELVSFQNLANFPLAKIK